MEINVEPYHPLGMGKSELLGKDYALGEVGFPSDEQITYWIEKIQSKTDATVKRA